MLLCRIWVKHWIGLISQVFDLFWPKNINIPCENEARSTDGTDQHWTGLDSVGFRRLSKLLSSQEPTITIGDTWASHLIWRLDLRSAQHPQLISAVSLQNKPRKVNIKKWWRPPERGGEEQIWLELRGGIAQVWHKGWDLVWCTYLSSRRPSHYRQWSIESVSPHRSWCILAVSFRPWQSSCVALSNVEQHLCV